MKCDGVQTRLVVVMEAEGCCRSDRADSREESKVWQQRRDWLLVFKRRDRTWRNTLVRWGDLLLSFIWPYFQLGRPNRAPEPARYKVIFAVFCINCGENNKMFLKLKSQMCYINVYIRIVALQLGWRLSVRDLWMWVTRRPVPDRSGDSRENQVASLSGNKSSRFESSEPARRFFPLCTPTMRS